jgi:Rieske Fe-S protein
MDKLADAQRKQIGDTASGSLTRRSFFGWLIRLPITTTLAGMLTAIIGCQTPRSTDGKIEKIRTQIGTLGDFPLNMGKVVLVKNRPIIVTNTPAAGLKAFSAICTHRACVVRWNKGGSYIQ